MAVTNEQIAAYLASSPNLSDAQIAQAMAQYGVSPAQMAAVTGLPVSAVEQRIASVTPAATVSPVAPVTAAPVTAAPVTAAPVTAATPTWDEAYSKYSDALRSGNISESTIKNLYGGLTDVLQPNDPFKNFSSNIIKIKNEIDAQKKAGTADYWGAGNLASPDSAAWDAAFRLAEKGVSSLYDLKQVDGQTVNTKTGQPLEGFGNAYNYDLDYNLRFNPEGVPVLTASNQASEWVDKYRTPLTAAALAALTYGVLSGAEGSLFAGTGGMTAEQLAAANALGSAEVAGGLTAAEAAAAGLGGGFGAAGAGLLSGLTAEQLAAMDALGSAEVAGGLTASEAAAAGLGGGFGAAGMTAEQLAAANALGGTEVAGGLTAPQATAAGIGGGVPAAATATSGMLSSLTPSQIANLVKTGVSLTGIAGAANLAQPTQASVPLQAPTQAMPAYTPEYYQQLQQYYNAYLPQTPRDVVGPLQQWYNAKSGA